MAGTAVRKVPAGRSLLPALLLLGFSPMGSPDAWVPGSEPHGGGLIAEVTHNTKSRLLPPQDTVLCQVASRVILWGSRGSAERRPLGLPGVLKN